MKRAIALGFFDGVHLGHAALLRRTVTVAREAGLIPTALTFDRHPASVITGSPVPLLTTAAGRGELMRRLYGISEVIVAPYDRQMMETPWRDFVTGFLVRDNGAAHVVVGHDFHFGYKGEGEPEGLRALCAQLGVGCDVVPKVELEGVTVSSSYIRELIRSGEMERAVRFLGHPHCIQGKVAHGKRLGSRLGFPTVNLTLAPQLLVPAYGVYAAKAWLLSDGDAASERREPECYLAVTNVGVRPTVDKDGGVTVESYLLDFDGDLYGRELRLELYHRLRPERAFESVEALRREIGRNVTQTRAYFA